MNKKIMMVLAAVLFNCMTGGLLAMAAGISPVAGARACCVPECIRKSGRASW